MLLLSFKCSSDVKKTAAKPKPAAAFNLITEKQFNQLFPQRNQFYTYAAFMQAVNELANLQVKVTRRAVSVYQYIRTDKKTGKSVIVRQDADWNEAWAKVKPDSTYTIDYANFCTEKDAQTNKKELAAFFAQIAHETRHGQDSTYTDGLMLIHEGNTSLPYVLDNEDYPAVPGQKYYGRGPMQLSYNGNYGKISDFLFGDKKVLLNNPALIETNPVIAFKTAIWFWMTPDNRKPSAHNVIVGNWQPTAIDKARGRVAGFGMTINIINGPVECNKGDNGGMIDRIQFYQYFLGKLGATDPNCACSCGKMQPYAY